MLKSTAICETAYIRTAGRRGLLALHFTSGGWYVYDVPSWEAGRLHGSDSAGRYYLRRIRGQYTIVAASPSTTRATMAKACEAALASSRPVRQALVEMITHMGWAA